MDNGYTLCVLCCCSFSTGEYNSKSSICQQDIVNFFKVLLQSPPQRVNDDDEETLVQNLEMLLDHSGLLVCSDCHRFITVALETRSRAEEMEMNVRKLQMQILEQLRVLNSEMELFHKEMSKIEGVVKTSDESCLMFHMPRNVPIGKSNGVVSLRDRILNVVTDLRIYQANCTAAKLPVDESEVEAMWEDAQQLVQCTPDISFEYEANNEFIEDFNTTMDKTEEKGTVYMGHTVGTTYFVDAETDNDDENCSEAEASPITLRTNSGFREDIIRRAIAREDMRTPEQSKSTDPLRKYYLKYDERTEVLSVGSVPVIINDVDETLQCSQCTNMGRRSKSNMGQSKQNWRDMEKGILVHIIGKHLEGFTCQYCSEVFTSHTMIKKHTSKEHSGMTTIADSSPLPIATAAPRNPAPSLNILPKAAKVEVSPPKKIINLKCSMCPSTFTKNIALKRHFMTKHATNTEGPLIFATSEISESPTNWLSTEVSMVTEATSPPTPKSNSSKRKRSKAKTGMSNNGDGGAVSVISPRDKVIPTKSATRPHECHVCKYAFTKKSHLTRHLQCVHKLN